MNINGEEAGSALQEPLTRMVREAQGAVPRILVVDDELDILELISVKLIDAGFRVTIAVSGTEALYKAEALSPQLVVLDVMLPDMDGFAICRLLREHKTARELPIIMLTARSQETDRVLGFESGANDYLTKPFSPRELLLRIRNLLSHDADTRQQHHIFRVGDLYIDTDRHLASCDGKNLSLTLTEFRLLVALVQRNGRVQSRERLLEAIRHGDKSVDLRSVDTHMARLREKLGKAAKLVDTVYGVGYRFGMIGSAAAPLE